MAVSHAVSTSIMEMYGVPSFSTDNIKEKDGYCSEMAGCIGDTYVEKKISLLHQLGYPNVTKENFADCKSEYAIDRRARSIMGI